MFTGLVQAVGTVAEVLSTPAGLRLSIDRPAAFVTPPSAIDLGESVAVNGCCLTTTAHNALVFDVVHETLAKTTLGSLKPGQRVNLERAVSASTLMGGHFVQGHIDGVGTVCNIDTTSGYLLTIQPSPALMPCMIPQGSVAIDGVSLTLARVAAEAITLALIPTTLQLTTLGDLRPGSNVNIEADMLVKAVVATMRKMPGR